jgi:CHAD domain-containing protein
MRACARRAARSTVGSTEFQRFLFRSLRWLQSEPWLHERTTLEQLAPARLERLYRKALAAFRWKNPRQRHALRIRIKRLRHACEFFAPCFPEGRARAFVRELSALQDMLGELNDLAVARRLLRALKAAAPTRLAAREARLMSALRAAGRRFQQRQPYWRRPG